MVGVVHQQIRGNAIYGAFGDLRAAWVVQKHRRAL
jgi:hypothetical protein